MEMAVRICPSEAWVKSYLSAWSFFHDQNQQRVVAFQMGQKEYLVASTKRIFSLLFGCFVTISKFIKDKSPL